jgi:outer membrane receptor protein involved in Fe transport
MLKIKKLFAVCCFILSGLLNIVAQKQIQGIISGFIIEKSSGQPLEFAQVILKGVTDSIYIQYAATDNKGEFTFEKVPEGVFKTIYSFIGYGKQETPELTINTRQNKLNLGKLYISEAAQTLGEVEVTGHRSTFVNSIDRKTFNVGEDLMSKTGTVSELLQNVPSVQVDIDGNVSLRGSENVTILINGKPSAMMNLNRAAVLQQIPASSIEKIEVITNPSAKYRPDGTSGIINIVMKKNKSLGFNGNVAVNIGNDKRYNGNAMVNYNPGKLNIFSNIGIRQDDRRRINDSYSQYYLNGIEKSLIHSYSENYVRPISVIAGLGADYKIDDRNKIGLSGNYNYRYQRIDDLTTYTKDSMSIRKEDHDRERDQPEVESDLELTSSFQHNLGKEGHELNLNYTLSFTKEIEDNYYTNTYRLPNPEINFDNMFYHHYNRGSQLLAEYANPFSGNAKLEAGYELDYTKNDMDLYRETKAMDQTTFVKDNLRSSRFIRTEYTHVLYVTFERELGVFGFLAGLRGEQTYTRADLVTKDTVIKSQYPRLYPTLHLSYDISDNHELQLNYSHRINRPSDEQLNPFPEYQDMLNTRAGNPYLKPEDIHSFEFGYQFKKQVTTFISTLYYRYNYNSITSITTTNGDTLISTLENLDKSTSAGLELILSMALGKFATINLNSNIFYNTIDASALGYSVNKANISFAANASVGINLTKSTVWQFTSVYTGESLTPQGKRLPSFVFNTGLKQELLKIRTAFFITVSDVFNSLHNNSIIDTPELHRHLNQKRSARIIYFGFTYNFGNSGKKQKEQTIKYDNQL